MAQTPSAPTSPEVDPHSTRQMLDELDALMERMLSLPVDDDVAEPEPAPPPPMVSASLTLMPPEPAPHETRETHEPQIYQTRVAFPEPAESVKDSAHASYFDLPESPLLHDEALSDLEAKIPTLEETTLSWLEQREHATQGERATKPETSLPTLAEMNVPRAPETVVPPSSGRMRGFWLWLTLRAVNGLFDLVTHLFGPFGEWLRGPRGRNVLGALGILMFLGAAGWLAALWMDWP